MKVKLTDIYVGKRRRIEMGDIEDLAEDLRKTGQITAITIRPPNELDREQDDFKGEPWVLVAGGRRYAAAQRNNWEEIGAHDVRELDDLEHRVMELHENVKRKDMTPIEVAQAKLEMLEIRRQQDPTITAAAVAKEIGETAANFSRSVAVAEAVNARPELAKAGSHKAILRQVKTIEHFEARMMRDNPAQARELEDKLVQADMRDWLRKLPNEYADLTFPDLPYGLDHFSQGHKSTDNLGISEYDDSEAVSKDLFFDVVPQLVRVTKRTGWVVVFMSEANYDLLRNLFNSVCLTHFDYLLTEDKEQRCMGAQVGDTCTYGSCEEPRWIWYRPNSINNPRHPEYHAKNVYEHILVYRMPEARLMRPCDNLLVYDAEYGNERIHAMQKPVSLCVDIISRTTLAGEMVIDPCYGSANHLRAAARLSRDFRGCDLNGDLRPAALGNVAKDYTGVAPKAARVDYDSKEYKLGVYKMLVKSNIKLNPKQQAEYDAWMADDEDELAAMIAADKEAAEQEAVDA